MSAFTPEDLFQEILNARQRVYAAGKPTPLQEMPIKDISARIFAKREDLGPIKAYKWRGAYNAMASLSPEQRAQGVVAASAGNHAQGVALAARMLGIPAVIFMPRSTPAVKQHEVHRHGQKFVEIILKGDTYDEAAKAAQEFTRTSNRTFIHPYNDLLVMAGQGTLADEVIMSGEGPFDLVYVPIGGGGLAAATACWIKRFWPECQIVGVEGVDQASMKKAVEHGDPVTLDYVDVFCDGTAVRKAGDNTFPLCAQFIDRYVTVTNDEVCYAIRKFWETNRFIPEPSGALSLAAVLHDSHVSELPENARVLVVVSGANMDFSQLAEIARRSGISTIGASETRWLRVASDGQRGSLVSLLNSLPENMNVIDVQYGRMVAPLQYIVLGLAGSPEDFQSLESDFAARGVQWQDVTGDDDVRFRIIQYQPETFRNPLFVHIEFPERPGAFLDFMLQIRDLANLSYFNYTYSGERVGRALVGMVFHSEEDRSECMTRIREMCGKNIRAAREMSAAALDRAIGPGESDD